uniref:Uncharacterized protein n=1 Tax=Anguilla anguilla TaxID=7936 RepID=A0A0E9QJ82_ANGAN
MATLYSVVEISRTSVAMANLHSVV